MNPTRPERTVLLGGDIFDGSGAPPAPGDLVIESGRVVAVGTDLDGDVGVDVTGQLVLPGLIDCHVHLIWSVLDSWKIRNTPFSLTFFEAARNMETTLRAGITTVRDAMGADYGMKLAQERGLIAGPRLKIAIQMLGQTGGHGDCFLPSGHDSPWRTPYPGYPSGVVDGVAAARRTVRELIRSRADWIKVAATGGVLSDDDIGQRQLRDDELAEIVAEAAAADIAVMAHAHAGSGITAAVRAGVRSVEHGVLLDDEAIQLMLDHGVWLVPTLVAPRAVLTAAESGTVSLPRGAVDKAQELVAVHAESFSRAVDAGVKIAMGTDTGVGIHGENLDELSAMVGAGMRPYDALHAATGSAAELLRATDDCGYLRAGARADVLVVDQIEDDLSNFSQHVAHIYQSGRLVPVRERTSQPG